MKLSEIKGEQALDVWADIIDPVSVILADDKVKDKFRTESELKLVQYIIKEHKWEVIEIMARLDGKDPADYSFSFVSLPMKMLEILNDPGISDLFTAQAQNEK